jgi:P4 family phage/plasmid primase-like protien
LLTGDRSEQIIVFFFGLGANGKSVFADAIHYILGDYARTVASETLIESKRTAGSATPDIAALIGARLALASETEDGAALAESLIKSMSGDGTMTARALYSSPIEFIPQFKLLILGNHKPIIKGNDYGIWRRVCLVPFKHTFSGESRDSKLLDKLKNEAPHILAWMVEGCLDWRRQGLEKIPNTIKIATEEYRQEQDLIGNWLSECCILSQDRETLTTDLYSNYKEWALRNGLRPASNVSLGRRLSERGLQCRKSNSKKYLIGIALDSELDNLNQ